MKTEKTNEDSINLDEKIALILSYLDRIIRHFKLDRRSKNNPYAPSETQGADEESDQLLRELSKKVGEIADRKEFTAEQIAELKRIFTGIANFFLKEQGERYGEIKSSLDAVAELLGALKAEKQDSIVEHHHRHAIEIASSKVFLSMIVMGLLILGLSFVIGNQRRTISQFRDNDLKYRYVKMHDGATPGEIKALETIFTYDRNADSVQLIRRQVIQYERLVEEQAEKIEQARLNASEAERLRQEVETVKGGR